MNTFVFFDDFMINSRRGIRKRIFSPVKAGVFSQDGITAGSSVVYVPEKGLYYLYYNFLPDRSRDWDRESHYAVSADGLNFTPAGRVPTVSNTGAYIVYRDDHTGNPEERYKCVVMKVNEKDTSEGRGYVAVSPDALNWNTDTEYRVSEHASDTSNNIFFNPVLGKYQIICRGAHIDRRITTLLSEDLRNWTDPRVILSPNPFDVEYTQYYGMTVYPENGYLLGFLQLYYTDEDDTVWTKMAGKVDVALTYSYDGIIWNRVSHEPMVERPMPPDFGFATIYFSNMNESPDGREWILAAGGGRTDHGWGFKPAYPDSELSDFVRQNGNNQLMFYKIRKHGFAGMESYGLKARLQMKRMRLDGGNLSFNLCAPTGTVRYRILDPDTRMPYEGFGFDECMPFTGDDIGFVPVWNGGSVGMLKGRFVMLEFEMHTAILFSVSGDLVPAHGIQPEPMLGIPKPMK
ncbi:MAG: hypothetical protein R6W99_00275 [Clostridia bacterium]